MICSLIIIIILITVNPNLFFQRSEKTIAAIAAQFPLLKYFYRNSCNRLWIATLHDSLNLLLSFVFFSSTLLLSISKVNED